MYGATVCDQCHVARALWVVALPSGNTLLFCNHHLNANREALIESGALIYQKYPREDGNPPGARPNE